jgi:hypothetical protein
MHHLHLLGIIQGPINTINPSHVVVMQKQLSYSRTTRSLKNDSVTQNDLVTQKRLGHLKTTKQQLHILR